MTNFGPDIETFTIGNLTVEIRSNETYFTVYNTDGLTPAGTIFRPSQLHKRLKWEVYNLKGECVGKTIGPRSALFKLFKYYKEQTNLSERSNSEMGIFEDYMGDESGIDCEPK